MQPTPASTSSHRDAHQGAGNAAYKLLYRLGITPWDTGRIPAELAELVEGQDARRPGRALDLGCGTGTTTVYLARHGWQATGVDFVERALQAARCKSAAAALTPEWVRGDVTRLPELNLGGSFDLVLDFGCYHGLSDEQRAAYAVGVTSSAAAGADLLLLAFAPGRRGPLPRGASREEIEGRFGAGWELLAARRSETRLPGPLRRAEPTTYRLRRRG